MNECQSLDLFRGLKSSDLFASRPVQAVQDQDRSRSITSCTVNFLNIRTPQKIVIITLKFEQYGSTIEQCVQMANSVDPDQEQSDLGLHCLPRPICPKTLDYNGNSSVFH